MIKNDDMKQDNDLLLKDLCCRLPYGVKVHAKYVDTDTEVEKVGVLSMMIDNDTVVAFTCDDTNCYNYVAIHEVKPYLFPLSSMTEDQKFEFCSLRVETLKSSYATPMECVTILQWCYKNHIDVSGLIPMGLANDATGLNIYGKTKKKNDKNIS